MKVRAKASRKGEKREENGTERLKQCERNTSMEGNNKGGQGRTRRNAGGEVRIKRKEDI